MESPECRALRRGSSLLKNGINPDDIVSDKKLLTPEERYQANASHLTPSKRMEEVHTALERRVSVTSEAFHTFSRALQHWGQWLKSCTSSFFFFPYTIAEASTWCMMYDAWYMNMCGA